MSKAVKKGRSLAAHFSRSSTSRKMLRGLQESSGEDVKAVIIGTENRWFFRHMEAKRLLELKTFINAMFNMSIYEDDETFQSLKMSKVEWELLKDYVNSLNPIVDAVSILSGSKYPTISSVIPILDTILDSLDQMNDDLDSDSDIII